MEEIFKKDRNSLSDEEIVYCVLKGKVDYFEVIYNRYAKKIYQKCLTFTRNKSESEDLLQEILIKIFTNLYSFRNKSSFSTWVYSIAHFHCINYLKHNKTKFHKNTRSIEEMLHLEAEKIENSADEDNNENFLFNLSVEELKKVLDYLPVDDKAILLLKFQDGLKINEICEVLELGESAVKMRIKRAKEKAKILAQKLQENPQLSI